MTKWLENGKSWLILPVICVLLFGAGSLLKFLVANANKKPEVQSLYTDRIFYLDETVIASNDIKDITTFYGCNPGEKDRMIQTGRIIPVYRMTRVQVVDSQGDEIVKVRLLEGVDKNAEGLTAKYALFELQNGSEIHPFQRETYIPGVSH